MTEEKKKKIQANIERTNARAEGRLSGANTNRDRANQSLGNYFAGTYIPQKANAYTQGVSDFNQRYTKYLDRTQSQKQYQSPDTFTRLEQQRRNAYENPNKQYAQMYARMQLEQGNNAPFQTMYGLGEASEKQKHSISGLYNYYSQFGSQEGYNNAMEQQRLLNYDVPAAKQRLEQLKADREKRVTLPTGYSYTYTVNDNDEEISRLENEVASAEELQQFAKDMKDPVKRAEYESFVQEQKSFEHRYSQMNPIEKIGHQLYQGVVGAGTQYFLKPAAFVSDLAGNVVGGGLKGAGETISYNSPFAPIGQGLRDVGQSVLNYTGKQTSDWQGYFDYLDRYAEYYKNGLRKDIGNEFVADAISIAKDSIIQILPTVAVAIASGGTSLGANAMLQASTSGNAVAKYANIATKMIQNAAKNPSFWMSFGAEGGSAYLDALNNGADTIEATIAMLATGIPNALIEVGSGIEAMPSDKSVKGIRNWLKSIGKSAHEEGMEEIQQGIISQLVGQLVNDDLHLFSVDGQTGIIDPVRMVQEYWGGFVGGSVGGVKVGYINYKTSQAQKQFQDFKVATIKKEGSLEKMKDIVEYASNSELTALYNDIASNTAEASREECIKLYDMLMDAADGTATNIIETNLSDNYGVSKSNAAEIAPIIQSLSYDNELTIDQAEVLANNPEISRVLGTPNISAEELVAISKNSTELQDQARVLALSRSEIDNFIADQVRIDERAKQAIDMIGLKNTTSAMGIKGIAPMAIERNGVTEEISIADSSAGRVLVRTPLGETFDAEDAPFARPETQTLVQLAGDYNTDTANTFVNAYPANMDMGEYASLFADVYNLAKTSKYSLQGLYRLYAPLTSHPSVIRDAYNAAIHEIAESRRAYEEKQASRRAKQKHSKGKLEISEEAQELVKKEHKTFADFIAKATKYTVRIIFDNEKMAQGTFDSTETEIVVNLAKGDFFSTMLHEVTHFIELNNVEGYNAFANEVMRYLSAKGILKETFDRYAATYSSEIESIDELSSEVVANAAEALMKSDDFLKELFTDKDFIQHIEGTEAQSFVNKVIAKLKEILDSIKQFMADATLNHTVAEVFAKDTEQLNRMVKLWTDAFKGAAMSEVQSIAKENTDTESSGIKFSKMENYPYDMQTVIKDYLSAVDEDVKEFAQYAMNHPEDRRGKIELSPISQREIEDINNLLDLDVSGYKRFANVNSFIHIKNGHGENGDTDHSMSDINDIARVNYILTNYDAIQIGKMNGSKEFKNSDGSNSPTVIYEKRINGTYYVVEAVPDSSKRQLHLVSAYINKKGAYQVPMTKMSPGGTPKSELEFTPSDLRIPQPPGIVNPDNKKSLPETDSKGNELTEQQREYFKDSKVVDSEGRLMVVYHGSPSKFTVFSHSKINSHGNAHGRGFYFTENKSLAEGYEKGDGQLLEGYLDIKKPLSEDKVTIKKSDVVKLIKAVCEKEAENLVADGGYESAKDAILDTWVSNYADTYSNSMSYVYREVADILYTNDNDVEIVAEITNAVGGSEIVLTTIRDLLGYDGVIYENDYGTHEYVALVSEQFKNIDNLTPTDDKDIRFSIPESDTASYDILARENEDLKAQVEALENEMKLTKGHKVKPEAVKKLARKLLREYSSTMDAEELSAELEKIFNYVADTENASADIASKAMYSLAKRIIDSSQRLDTTLADEYKHVTDYLRKVKIRVSPGMEAELDYLYGKYNNFRRANFGRLSLSRDNGSAVDSVWQELNSLAPELFPEEAFPDSDMLPRIAEALDVIAPEYVNPYGQDADTFISGLASEIFDNYFDMPEVKTFADKQKAKLDKEIYNGRKRRAEQRARDKAKFEERLKKEREVSTGYRSKVQTAENIIKEYEAEYGSKTALPSMSLRLIALSDHVKNRRTKKAHNLSVKIATELYEKQNLGLMKKEDIPDVAKRLVEDSKQILKVKNTTIAEEYKDSADLEKAKLEEKLMRQKAKYQGMAREKADRQRESAEKSKLRHRIEKNTKTMLKWFDENSDKHHIPEVLREAVAIALGTLDFVSYKQRENERVGKPSQATINWNTAFEKLYRIINQYTYNESNSEKELDFELDIDPDFLPRLNDLLTATDLKPIPEMNSEQLREIDYIVTVLKSAITTANSFYLNRMAENVAEIGDATISQLQAKKSKRLNNNAVDKLLNMHMLDSGSFFRELGPAAESIYAEIREGFNKRVRCIEQAQKYMQELLKDVDVSDWTGDKATVHTFKINGEELKMTTAQMMSLYELWKRKQAQEHITKGGIVPTEIRLGKKLLNKVFGAVEPVRLSETDLVRIFSELTPQQREIADKMQKFLSKNCSDWGNEVSMAMYGYRKFTEPDYFPIKSSDNEVKSSDGNTSQSGLYKIKNQGMTKATVKGANNAIQVDDIFNTFTTHVVEMADYNAYAMPLSDAMKWYNYKVRDSAGRMNTIKGEMERTYGSQAKAYFIQLIKDINGDAGNATASEISTALLGKMKAASVAGNVRVALQQPTSIARAMVLMDPQYIGLGVTNMLKNPNKAIKEAQEHSSIAQWKSWGYFDTGLGKSLKEVITGQTPLRDKIVEKTMILAAYGDKVTWGALWEACKLEVAKNISPDSNGYMEAVTKRFDEIIDKTQVVDTVLHRSQIMRSKDTAVKMATSFMSEPTKTYNLMRNAITDVYHNKTKESATRLARTTSAVMFTAVLTAAAAALSDAFRDDDKSKDWGEKYIDNFFENIVDNVNPLNMIPYFKDIVSAIQGYDVERSDVAALVGFGQFVMQLFGKVEDGKEINFFNTVYDMSRYVSQFTGIPIFNLLREADSVIDIFADPLFRKDKTKAADVYVKLYDALISDNDAETDKMYQKLIEDGKDLQAIESGLRTQLLNPESEIYEERIVEAAKARLDGNTAEYMRLMKEVIADTGLSQDFWVKTVNTQINRIRNDGKELSEDKEFLIKNGLSAETVEGMTEQQIKETVKQYQTSSYKDLTAGDGMSLYDMNDLATTVTKGDTESFKEVYQDILEAKVDELLQKDNLLTRKKAEEKAKSSIKSSITSKIKPIVQDLYKTNKDKFAKLRTFLMKYLGYDSKTVNNWTNE